MENEEDNKINEKTPPRQLLFPFLDLVTSTIKTSEAFKHLLLAGKEGLLFLRSILDQFVGIIEKQVPKEQTKTEKKRKKIEIE